MLVHPAGSPYREPRAPRLPGANGDYSGLLSGGCLESDLREHARTVILSGEPRAVHYDLRAPDDLLWGLGLGGGGAMPILLLRAGPENDWHPLAHLAGALAAHAATAIGVVTESARADVPVGTLALPSDAPPRRATPALTTSAVHAALAQCAADGQIGWVEGQSPSWRLFVVPLSLPPRILVLGAGRDAR